MPRTRKTQSGERAQPVGAVAGQEYGMGVQQMELQRQMPLPQTSPVRPETMTAQGGGQPAAVDRQPLDAARIAEIARTLQGGVGALVRPSGRPGEPVTAGLSSGPGPGPEVLGLRTGNPTGMTMRNIARLSGDSYLADLADRAGM